jgi:hypothetical protein
MELHKRPPILAADAEKTKGCVVASPVRVFAMIDATQAGTASRSQEPLGVFDPNISAKSIAGKLAVGTVTS